MIYSIPINIEPFNFFALCEDNDPILYYTIYAKLISVREQRTG